MTAPMTDLTTRLRDQQRISAEDALQMRRIVWQDGEIDPSEADAIFDLNGTVKSSSRDWVDFFVEAMTVYLVRQQAPQGYVDEAKAAWLMARIDHDGRVDTLAELELLAKILEDATSVPDTLKSYTLAQIERVVLTGSGPTRDGGTVNPRGITEAEVALLRRVLFAQAGDGPAIISRAEAEMLFRVKDATRDADNTPSWQKLFVQAVGNHLMAIERYQPPSRDEATRLDHFMASIAPNTTGFLARIGSALIGNHDARSAIPAGDRASAADANHTIIPTSQAWLSSAIDRDGERDELETALLAFIVAEQG